MPASKARAYPITKRLFVAAVLAVPLEGCSSCAEDKRVHSGEPPAKPASTISVFRLADGGHADGGRPFVHVGRRDQLKIPVPPDAGEGHRPE